MDPMGTILCKITVFEFQGSKPMFEQARITDV